MQKVLTIAGSDPSGGAGIQADLKVFSSFGVYGMAVISALTAQNTEGIYDIMDVPPEFVDNQLISVLRDMNIDAVKTGMLYSPEIIEIIRRVFNDYKIKNLVVDPVIKSSTGTLLIKEGAIEKIKKTLFPLATIVTPNIYEASVLSGISIKDINEMKQAAKILKDLGAETVIITGGHLEDEAIDILYDGKEFFEMKGEKIKGTYHGSGCVYSAAITAYLALGYSIKDSALRAKDFVTKAIKNSYSLGKGLRVLGF
ncbi:MAG: bifunctional hydroxymethylpyrimidine kinase/phosphomethylpyrimidine kinase [Nitrospirota bacterium]